MLYKVGFEIKSPSDIGTFVNKVLMDGDTIEIPSDKGSTIIHKTFDGVVMVYGAGFEERNTNYSGSAAVWNSIWQNRSYLNTNLFRKGA